MRTSFHRAAFGLLVASSALAAPAFAADPATIARSGAAGLAPCASCHGAAGEGQASFPRLAGMDADYLARQLDQFASGERASAIMAPVAKALDPADRVALAEYYAGLPVPAASPPGDGDPLGARLALHGAWDKGVPACVQCHGPEGRGVGAAFPAIAAQPAGYITSQLKAFRDGQRTNDPLQLMRTPAAQLTDAEIDAVARWFSTRPARRAGGAP
jgi:cytochrome c553